FRSYRKRLAEDLPRWRDAGWVTADGVNAILASLEGRRSGFGLAATVGVLGALLLGAGVIAFVGANWEAMPRIVRFVLLVAAMAVAYGIAGLLAARELRAFSEAALLAAGLVFAAAIALVGQTYHLSGECADAVLLWEIGIVGATLLTRSPALTMLALVGGGYWTWLNVVELGVIPHWGGLALVLIGGAIALWINAAHARLVAVLALGFWIGLNLVGLAARLDWTFGEMLAVATAAALLFWAAGMALSAAATQERLAELGQDMLWPGLAAVLVAVGLLQTTPYWSETGDTRLWMLMAGVALIATAGLVALAMQRRHLTIVDAVGAVAIGLAALAYDAWQPDDAMPARLAGGIIVLGAALWAVNLGQGTSRTGKKTGLSAFGIEVIYLYVVTLGTLIDTALAFLIGGLLFIALAYGLYRLDRRLARAAPVKEATP